MPKVKIIGLPKYANGGTPPNCDPGYTADPDNPSVCIPQQEAYAKMSAKASGIKSGQDFYTSTDPKGNQITSSYDPNNPIRKAPNDSYLAYRSGTQTSTPQDCPKGYQKNAFGYCVPKKTLLKSVAELGKTAGLFFGALAQDKENRRVEKEFLEKELLRKFSTINEPSQVFKMGNVETASGVQFPNMMTPPNEGMFSNAAYGSPYAEFGGFTNESNMDKKVKIKILETPGGLNKMKFGGQSSYGLDLGWRIGYTDMAKTKADHHGNTISENSDPNKVLEAEGGETLYKPGGAVGDSELYNISGKRHSNGGVKLSKDQVQAPSNLNSFIFSDTAALKIKDPKLLEFFGLSYKKGGHTPAAISKKFELNKYKAILEDPVKQSDALAMRTAELMSSKNEKMLKFLAAVQEDMKGEEIPEFAADSIAQFGGYLLPSFNTGGETDNDPPVNPTPGGLGEWSKDYETLQRLLLSPENAALRKEMFDLFLQDYPNSKLKNDSQGQEKFINNFLEAQRQIFIIENAYKDKPEELTSEDWDTGGKNRRYYKEAKKFGFTPLSNNDLRRFQGGYRALKKASQDPKHFETFGKYIKLEETGVADEPEFLGEKDISLDDSWFGNTLRGQKARLKESPNEPVTIIPEPDPDPDPDPKPKFLCIGNGTIIQTTIGYDTEDEARKHCPKPPVKPPHDFLQPDKLNMIGAALNYPELILPMVGQQDFVPGQLSLEDWRAKAAQRFSTQYAAPAAQLASNTGAQGLTSRLSMLAGQTAQQMAGEDIAPTHARNVERVNQFSQIERGRKDAIDNFNLLQRLKGDEGRAIARQNLAKEKREYIKQNVDAYAQAYLNRAYNTGAATDNFYLHPRTGNTVFMNRNTLGIAGLPSGGSSDYTTAGNNFNTLYKSLYDSMTNVPQEKRAAAAYELAMDYMGNTQTVRTKKDAATGETVRTKGISFGT
jgi:hypothetical protein